MAENKVTVLAKGVTTPIGKALYPKLFRPDTKFDADGVYSVDIVFQYDSPEWAAFQEEMNEYAAAYQKEIKKKLKTLPYSEVVDDEGDPTGEIKLKAKLKAVGKYGPRRVAVYDSRNKQIVSPIDIGNGSELRAKVNVKGYNTGANCGLTLELISVQILELVEYQGGGNTGFEAVDGGFVAPEVAAGDYDDDAETEESADY